MFTLKDLPEDYKSLNSLTICSNKLIGGGFPFALGDGLPLIIGSGKEPKVWLQAVEDPQSKKLILLVDGNISTVKEISVTKPEKGVIEVYFKGVTRILRVKQIDNSSAVISFLDLRPIGLNITGNQDGLNIAGSSFSGNTFQGSSVFIGLG
ncbi:hypothetical protein [Acinetobacter cumulans]|uniref:hypothetical protein n=1 Tax=Acinetobacter cumulans TaxID=2136182 RepID=UPI00144431E9|nr:hypothetical protein [Acinetobacter cumulans]